MREPGLCASPTCSCETADFTCSLWCGSFEIPAGARCLCRHDVCLRDPARGSPSFHRAAGSTPSAVVLAHKGRAVA